MSTINERPGVFQTWPQFIAAAVPLFLLGLCLWFLTIKFGHILIMLIQDLWMGK